ncbi:peptidoglycan DD-metalloendopeptidase family protein [Nocardioides donggukensis]|uniref:Peptidoglycan DD-metalloendopeptidase family protein n=1 Tax=Nocardioides donggukensis TaxID=2774019 RepID=A0A927K329_9ACTN|nr:peptidoglycan DD-metalloendopeptidase family protein [Nocardioides donggukensis]MBD8869047.1 peptidoglycan DD-metalloendopeptidase family protein [Nocardioides donggukensis]
MRRPPPRTVLATALLALPGLLALLVLAPVVLPAPLALAPAVARPEPGGPVPQPPLPATGHDPAQPRASPADVPATRDVGPAHDVGPIRGEWPLSPPPPVLADFDPPSVPWGAGHRGVDLGGRPGDVVRSALPGRVTFAGRIAGRGVVVVGHGDTRTTYEPVVADVRVGERVGAGAPLGRLEILGSHCLPAACLHWGWLRGEVYLDPLDLVGRRPVRLLPLDGLPVRLGGAPDGRRCAVAHC